MVNAVTTPCVKLTVLITVEPGVLMLVDVPIVVFPDEVTKPLPFVS